MYRCKICNNKGDVIISVKEMMFGDRDQFQYLECAHCRCLQLMNIPEDFSKYYRQGYYSLGYKKRTYFIERFKIKWAQQAIGNESIIGKLLLKYYGEPAFIKLIKEVNIKKNSSILDIGCGNGALLLNMSYAGFTNLTGVDPFIQGDIIYNANVRILKKGIFDLNEQFDFIMLNHSFEHMSNQLEVLIKIYELLKKECYLLIRMPVTDKFSYRCYHENWVQIDAPRHIIIHSEKSMEIIAADSGFVLDKVIYDSNAFQFYGSEQYKLNIPLMDKKSHWINPSKSIFSKKQITEYSKQAFELNKNNDGDQACFYLSKE